MASLESKLLDGEAAGYCSSSDGEDDGGWKVAKDEDTHQRNVMQSLPGTSNTGAKGVLSEFQSFRIKKHREQVKHEREQKNKQIMAQARKGMLEGKKEDIDKAQQLELEDPEEDLDDLRARRLQEMRKALTGRILEVTDQIQYLEASESKAPILVLIMIYEIGHEPSEHLTHVFKVLAADFPNSKFLRVKASLLGTTKHFKALALPTVQVFFQGNLVGNFVCIDQLLPEEYNAANFQDFLKRREIYLDQNRFGQAADVDEDSDLSD